MSIHCTPTTPSFPRTKLCSPSTDFCAARRLKRLNREALGPVPAPDAAHLSPNDLLQLLDDLSESASGPGTAGAHPPPLATPVSPPLVLSSSTTGPSSPPSTSTFTTTTTDSFFPPPPHAHAATGLGFDPSSSSSFALSMDQVAPQHSDMSSFHLTSKPFDAGDILLPFDLEPASATSAALDLLAFPVFDHLPPPHTGAALPSSSSAPYHPSHAPAPAPAHPATLDALLDSPLGLAAPSSTALSDSTSPLSEFLASPMFSLIGGNGGSGGGADSTVPSATMSELPLPTPSPYEHAYAYSAAAAAYSAAPGLAWFPPLPAEASSVLPSATSKRRKTSAAEKALARRAARDDATSVTPDGAPPVDAAPPPPTDAEDDDHLPPDIVAAVERKRLQNTLSARKSRARKQARVQELEGENEALRRRVGELEALLGLAMAGAGAGAA
ncbi:hypothetical protein JCM8208_002824 [Rhodotorula glutinis]